MKPPLPRLTLMATAIAALISVIANATEGDDGQSAPSIPEVNPLDPRDLGRQHAAGLVSECHDDDERALRLLDVRARETIIRTRIGFEAADEYVAGFEEGLRQYSDSLARVILEPI